MTSCAASWGRADPGGSCPPLLQAVAENDPDPVCRLVLPGAETALLVAAGTTDCPSAVGVLHGRAPAGTDVDTTTLPQPRAVAGGWEVDACQTAWATAAGRRVGVIAIGADRPGRPALLHHGLQALLISLRALPGASGPEPGRRAAPR